MFSYYNNDTLFSLICVTFFFSFIEKGDLDWIIYIYRQDLKFLLYSLIICMSVWVGKYN